MPVKNVEWKKFLDRKGIKQAEVSRLLGTSPAIVTGWVKEKNAPGFFYLQKLAQIGMTAQEMFGEEIGSEMVRNSAVSPTALNPDVYDTPEFRERVQKIVAEMERDARGNENEQTVKTR